MTKEAPAGVRRRDAAPIAIQQRLLEFDLELAHLMAQRGLGDVEQRRGLGEAAQIGDVHEVLKVTARPVVKSPGMTLSSLGRLPIRLM
jgi:hypothetical protein